jgi:hypothetical protein
MLTPGLFATSFRSPVFTGFCDPDARSGNWATPRFAPDQVTQIIDWVMSAPDDGESIRWEGKTVIHCLGVGEADQEVVIHPDPDGRYSIGWHAWAWIERPAPAPEHREHLCAQTPQPIGSAPTDRPIAPGSETLVAPAWPAQAEAVYERVHHVGWRTIMVRACTRGPLQAGFDVFANGQRLTHADPFPAEPTIVQLRSFLSMRKRGLDLLMAEHGAHDEDLNALLHGTQDCPRYAAIARSGESSVVLTLHETLAEAVRRLRDHAQDRRTRILGVQDLDGEFLATEVQVMLATGGLVDDQGAPIPPVHDLGTGRVDPLDWLAAPRLREPAIAVEALSAWLRSAWRACTRRGAPAAAGLRENAHGGAGGPVPAVRGQRQQLSQALNGMVAGVALLGRCTVALTALALTVIAAGCGRPRRLPPRHRATTSSSGFLRTLREHHEAPGTLPRHVCAT